MLPVSRSSRRTISTTQIDAKTEVYGVIGDPIEQSLSPAIHNAAFRHLGLNKVLVPFLVPSGELETFFKELVLAGDQGLQRDHPPQGGVVALLQQKEGAVERTASCNTVVIEADGRRVGYNTDYRAAMDSLESGDGRQRRRRGGEPAARQAGADPGGRGSRPVDRLRPDEAAGLT